MQLLTLIIKWNSLQHHSEDTTVLTQIMHQNNTYAKEHLIIIGLDRVINSRK